MPAISPPAAPVDSNRALAAALARWRALVAAELKGVPFEKKLVTRIPEGVALQPLYTRSDLANVPHLETRPGEAPFLRGTRPAGHGPVPWIVAQEIVAASAAEFNRAVKQNLSGGQNAVVLTPDRASRAGRDPDEAVPEEVGADGLSLADVDDFAEALEGVDLTAVPIYLHTGADPLALATLFLEYARSRGSVWSKLTGGVTADPLGEWAVTGKLPGRLDASYDSLAGWTAWTETYLPALKTIGVSAVHWNDAGATATQELAFALATAVEYLRAVHDRDTSASEAAARMEFRFAIGPQFFTEIAKFRAWRLLWTRVVAVFHGDATVAGLARVRAVTGHTDKTRLDPHVNMLRANTQALAAALGGVDTLHIAAFDEVTGTTSEFSRRIARNVHALLAEEFGFTASADAAGGSWYVEKLTDELARKAWGLFQEIEGRGGFAEALRSGYPQELVAKTAAEKREAVAKRRSGLVGTNIYPNLKETPLTNGGRVDAAMRGAEIAARRGATPARQVTPDWATRFAAALSLARDGATVGQLHRLSCATTLTEPAITAVTPLRLAADFEALRAATAAETGARPRVFLAKIGPVAQHKARADFSAGFFAVGGLETIAKQSFETARAAAEAAVASGAPIAVLCSSDETYPMLAPEFGRTIKAANPKIVVVLAGLPADPAVIGEYRAAGIDEFIHTRANAAELLGALLKRIGVTP